MEERREEKCFVGGREGEQKKRIMAGTQLCVAQRCHTQRDQIYLWWHSALDSQKKQLMKHGHCGKC